MVSTCLYPLTVKNKYTGELVTVACGHCSACLSQKSLSWATRCQLESKAHRYSLFFTLTYHDSALPVFDVNRLPDELITDSLKVALENSRDFIDFHHGLVPCVSVDDIQKFLKRLRSNLYRNYAIPEKERSIRYFISSEYGPTTFRPHYHGILWFDSDLIAKNIKDVIYKSWFSEAGGQTVSQFFKRNRCEFVRFNAAQYVAGYINSYSNLPPILKEKPFRTKSLKSSNPPIGTLLFSEEQIREFVFGSACTLSFTSPSSFKQFDIPLWSCFENRLFPRIKGFSKLSASDRLLLYTISSFPNGNETTCEQFVSWLRSQWCTSFPLVRLLRTIVSDEVLDSNTGFPVFNDNKARRLFYQVRTFRNIRRKYGFTVRQYLSVIENYFSRKDYMLLVKQLEYQVELSNRSPLSHLKYYPCFIDSQFYENKRSLSVSVFESYCCQFGISDSSRLCAYLPQNFVDWQNLSYERTKVLSDNSKTRKKKEFLSLHPEYMQMYKKLIL